MKNRLQIYLTLSILSFYALFSKLVSKTLMAIYDIPFERS